MKLSEQAELIAQGGANFCCAMHFCPFIIQLGVPGLPHRHVKGLTWYDESMFESFGPMIPPSIAHPNNPLALKSELQTLNTMSATKATASAAKQAARFQVNSAKARTVDIVSNANTQKYTVQPTGIWARINRWLAVDPNRSTGVPLNAQFRNPPPGALDPASYDDPVTLPAADIAENPYWKRDVRRRYPQLSTVTQSDVVGLLTVGSQAEPKRELIGDAGQKQLIAVKEEGEKGLAAFFEKEKGVGGSVLGPGGLPPFPTPLNTARDGTRNYRLLQDQSYGEQ